MKTHRADILQGYIDSGLSPTEAIQKFKTDHPEYSPKHRNEQGEPMTFEAVVSDKIRKQGMTPDFAIWVAASRFPRLQRDYYERMRVGAAVNLEWIIEGNQV